MKKILIFLLLIKAHFCVAQQIFEPATKISFILSPEIIFSGTSFEYSYALVSSTSSSQNIWTLDMHIDTGSISGINAPAGWSKGTTVRGTVSWAGIDPAAQIKPGLVQTGFSFTSLNLPDVVDVFAQGYVPLPPPVDHVDETLPSPPDPEIDSVHMLTLGPSTSAFTDTASAIKRLISLKHQSASLGWISGPGSDGIVSSLDAKLNAAQDSVSRGDNTSASNQLNAFINELDAQRGKHLNDNAYFLLKANAQFIIYKLGSP